MYFVPLVNGSHDLIQTVQFFMLYASIFEANINVGVYAVVIGVALLCM